MRSRLALAALALSLAVGACNQDAPTSANTPADEPQGQVGQITAGNLIAALNNVAVQINRLSVLDNLTIEQLRVVNVEDVLNNARILNKSHFLNNITILQNFLNDSVNNNNVLTNVLRDANINISDVVAINVLSGGDVVVFTR